MRFIQWLIDLFTRMPETVTSALSLRGRFAKQRGGDDPAPGTWDARHHAYRRFADAAIDASLKVQFLSTIGAPPKIAGLLWTLPAVMRANRGFVESSYEAVAALHEIDMVGDRAVLEAAITVASGLGKLSTEYRPSRGGRKKPPAKFNDAALSLNQAIADFAEAARNDLQQPKTP